LPLKLLRRLALRLVHVLLAARHPARPLPHLARAVALLAERRLLVGAHEAVSACHLLDLGIVEDGQLLAGADVGHVLEVSLCEDEIDLLEGALLCLRVEEVDDRDEAGVGHREEEVRAPPDVGDHDRRHHHDQEVRRPVDRRADGVGAPARADRVDLRGVQPWEWQPCRAEEGNVREEADGGALARGGVVVGDHAPHHEHHAQALADAADEEQLAAADAIDDEPRGGGEDGVDDHVDAAEQHGQVVGAVEHVPEQDGEVVDDGVAAADLLHQLRRRAQDHAPEVLRLAVRQKRLERRLAAHLPTCPDAVQDDVLLQLRGGVVLGEAVQRGDDGDALLVAVAGQQPAGGFREVVRADDKDDAEDDLEGDGEAPGEFGDGALRGAVVDPVGDHGAEGDDAALDADQQAAVVRARALGLVRGDGGRVLRIVSRGSPVREEGDLPFRFRRR